jgi:hypothetical protein
MRVRVLLPVLLLSLAAPAGAQTPAKSTRELERFNVSGLPASPSTETERQIFLFLKVHRKGDLADATRIHMMLAQYYKAKGDAARADDCNRLAADAWNAASGSSPETAGAAGTPPFHPDRTFRRTFVYTDDLNVAHTWEFYVDGSFSHAVNSPSREAGPTETGWYTREDRKLRLWQHQPSVDRTVDFELLGPDGSEGAVMAGARMKPGT